MWVTEPDAGLVARVDPARRAVTATIPVGTKPGRVVAAGGQVWVLDRDDRTLSRIDPQTDTVAQTIALPSQPGDVLLSAGTLWVASREDGTVLRIDPAHRPHPGRSQDGRGPESAWPRRTARSGRRPTARAPSRGSTPGPAR